MPVVRIMAEVRLAGVAKSFGPVEVLKDIDLVVPDGAFVVLVGPSGCGKSTLLRAIAGLERASAGTIHIGGRLVNDLAPAERKIAMVFQSYALYPHMDVRGNMGFGLRFAGLPRPEIERRVAEAARMLKLEELLNRKPRELSGGQRQRVAVARALTLNPRVIVADEAVSMIDVSLRVSILNLLLKLREDLGVTFLFITHDLAIAKYFAWTGHIGVMYLGQLVEYGRTPNVIADPTHPYTRALLAAIPEPDPDLTRKKEEVQLRSADLPSLLNLPSGCTFHPRCPMMMPGICDAQPLKTTYLPDGRTVRCHLYPATPA